MSSLFKLVYVDTEGLEVIEVSEDVNPPKGLTCPLETVDIRLSSGFYVVEKRSKGVSYNDGDTFRRVDIESLAKAPQLLADMYEFLSLLPDFRGRIPDHIQRKRESLEQRLAQIKIIGGN